MTEYERGFIDGIKSKVSAELTPTLINVSKTMLEMLKPVLSTTLENALNDNNAITDTGVQPVKRGRWTWDSNAPYREHGAYKCSNCGCHSDFEENYCYSCGADMRGGENND